MSLLSRSAEGGRRGAKMAAVFAGTLMMYLVVTAIPAMAVSTCVAGPVANSALLTVSTDARVILFPTGPGAFLVLEDGQGAPIPCPAATAWLNIVGQDNGTETVVLFDVGVAFPSSNMTIDLGNGNDTLTFEYGATVWNSTPAPTPIAEFVANNQVVLGAGAGGSTIADLDAANPGGDVSFNHVETTNLNMGAGNDVVDAGNLAGIAADAGLPTTTADNIAGTTIPTAINLNVVAGAGTDAFSSGDGNDVFNGGADNDLVSFAAASVGVTVDLAAGTGTGQGSDSLIDVQIVTGSNFADTITGSIIDNVLDGGDGDDVIDGGAGNDTITGGADSAADANTDGGNDTLRGGDGNDTVSGQDGDDVVDEGAASNGADVLSGGTGSDTLDHSARTTSIQVIIDALANDGAAAEGDLVGPDFETYLGGSAADHYEGGPGAETFKPGGGDDFVDGNGGADVLDVSEATTDTTIDLPAGTANGDGNDTFEDIEGAMTGSGNDTIVMDDTTGVLFNFAADGGHDTVDASATTTGVNINLALYGSPPCQPNCEEVEDAIGGSGNDTITGTSQSNNLVGGDGGDVINAGLGNDTVEGGLGNDTLNDGGGFDILIYRNASSGETIDTANGFATGGDGDDQLNGGWEEVRGSDFADTITGGQSSVDAPNRLKGFGGNDIIFGTNSTDTVAGGAGNDQLRGGGGDDVVKGSAGNDLIIAGSGDDTLKGGGGNDELQGGKGFDVGNGGKGDDFCNGVEVAKSC